jgi:signal transduction histidine kinase
MKTFFKRMIDWWLEPFRLTLSPAPPQMLDIEADQQRRQSFLRVVNRGWLLFGLATLISSFFYMENLALFAIIVVSAFGTYAAIGWLNHRGRTHLASVIFVWLVDLTFWIMFLSLALGMGARAAFDTQATVMMLAGLAILFAGALIRPRAAFALAAVNTIILIVLRLWLDPLADPRPSVALFYWLLALIVWLYESTLGRAQERLRHARLDLEKIVAERTRSLQETVDQLQHAKSDLESANKELEAFSYSVSHDLRAPLRSISGFSKILIEDFSGELSATGKGFLRRVQNGAQDMNHLIDALLDFSHLGRQEINKHPVDMAALAKQVMDDLREQEHGRKIETLVGDLPHANADLALIRQVYANLLGNAVKFTGARETARVEMNWIEQNNEIVYYVRDNGAGFDMQYADKLFGIFQRLHSLEEFAGTGIGLATVKRIIQRHGGRIWAESRPDAGATFYFTLGESTGDKNGR